jgi:hypothetical protein
MSSRVSSVRACLSRPWKRGHAGRPRGGRWPAGGGPISRLARAEHPSRLWQVSSHNTRVGRRVAVVMGVWLGRAGGEGAPPDVA